LEARTAYRGHRRTGHYSGLLVFGVDIQDITIHLIETHAGKQPIECGAAYDKRHPGGNCLILYGTELHLSFAGPPR
jgi:hypothetical protein